MRHADAGYEEALRWRPTAVSGSLARVAQERPPLPLARSAASREP